MNGTSNSSLVVRWRTPLTTSFAGCEPPKAATRSSSRTLHGSLCAEARSRDSLLCMHGGDPGDDG
jgi:hypothetical protein